MLSGKAVLVSWSREHFLCSRKQDVCMSEWFACRLCKQGQESVPKGSMHLCLRQAEKTGRVPGQRAPVNKDTLPFSQAWPSGTGQRLAVSSSSAAHLHPKSVPHVFPLWTISDSCVLIEVLSFGLEVAHTSCFHKLGPKMVTAVWNFPPKWVLNENWKLQVYDQMLIHFSMNELCIHPL
jgi:hypothetical protein